MPATPMYMAVGKMFMLSPRDEIKASLREQAEAEEKRVAELKVHTPEESHMSSPWFVCSS